MYIVLPASLVSLCIGSAFYISGHASRVLADGVTWRRMTAGLALHKVRHWPSSWLFAACKLGVN
jgi:hypothetical protein